MTFHFHPEAAHEFERAIDYYEECKPRLGEDFAFEVFATIERIVAYPEAWPKTGRGIRRCLTNRFP